MSSPAVTAALESKDIPALQRADPKHWQSALAARGWGPVPLRDWLLELALDAEVSRLQHDVKVSVQLHTSCVLLL